MTPNTDPISASLNLSPIPGDEPGAVMKLINSAFDDSAKTDFTTVRNSILALIDSGKTSLNDLAEVARQSQNPRAYEVYAKLMDSIVNATDKLLDSHAKIRTIDAADSSTKGGDTINNNLFVGSTAEMAAILKQIKNNE